MASKIEEFSRVRKEWIEVSKLYPGGFLLLKDDDLKPWIENNTADHSSVRCLELLCLELAKLGESIGESGRVLSQLTHLYISHGYFKYLPGQPSPIPCLPMLPHFVPKPSPALLEFLANLADFKSLTYLSLIRCPDIKSLPNSIVNLSALKTLHLEACASLVDLPAISNVVELILVCCHNIRCLPRGLCSNLDRLHLKFCESLTELPAILNVRQLEIKCCHNLKPLLAATRCSQLNLSACRQQIIQVANFTCFQNLTHLTLHTGSTIWCQHEILPVNLGDLSQLSFLNIQKTKTEWLPWRITTKLTRLSFLLLPIDFRLETLPERLKDSLVISVADTHARKTWKGLKTDIKTFSMPIIGEEEDQFLDSTPRYLQLTGDPEQWILRSKGLHFSMVKLLDLNLRGEELHSDAMDCIGKLPQLTHLHIIDASFCDLLPTFERITHISLSSCRISYDFCFDALESPPTLQSLKLLQCVSLLELINDFPISLTHLALELGFHDSRELHPDIYMAPMRKLSNLNTLELSQFQDLNLSLLNPNLAKLKIRNCSIMSLPTLLKHLEIIHSKGRPLCAQDDCCNQLYACLNQLMNLETLSVTCYHIGVLPSVAGLKKLQQLHLKDCFNLKQLAQDLGELVELCTLDVSGIRIKSLPGSITELQKLRHLILPKHFIHENLPKNSQVKVTVDETDEMYYEDAGYYDSCYSSRENEITLEGGDQVVSQESSHNITPDFPQGREVGERSSHAPCNPKVQISVLRNYERVGNYANDVAATSSSYIAGKEKEISEERIRQCISQNMTISEAAISLGVCKSTLKRKNKKYKIKWPRKSNKKQRGDAKNKGNPSLSLMDASRGEQRGTNRPAFQPEIWPGPALCDQPKKPEFRATGRPDPQFYSPLDTTETYSTDYDHGTEHTAGAGSCNTIDVKATYGEDTVRIDNFPLNSSMEQLKEKVGKELELEVRKIKMKYFDKDNEWILMTKVSNLAHAQDISSQPSGKRVIKLSISLET